MHSGARMPRKLFFSWIDGNTMTTVEFHWERKEILSFVVKLEVLRGGKWREIQRYDTHHDSVHKDVLLPNGSKHRVIMFEYLDASSGLTAAIEDFKDRSRLYVGRWEDGDKSEETDGR